MLVKVGPSRILALSRLPCLYTPYLYRSDLWTGASIHATTVSRNLRAQRFSHVALRSAAPQALEEEINMPSQNSRQAANVATQGTMIEPPGTSEAAPLSDFDLSTTTRRLLKQRGINALFPIQAATFPPIIMGKDVVGRAKTGTGKTLGFALPVLERLRKDDQNTRLPYGRSPRVLVLAPTRELAKQVSDEFAKYGPEYSVLSVYGGAAYGPQEGSLRRGTDIVVGTPGRLLDHLEKQTLRLDNIKTLIMDEADHMLDMGFAPDMERILSKIKEEKKEATMHSHQTLLFSATMPVWVRKVSRAFLKPDQVMIDLVGEDVHKVADTVTHFAIACESTAAKAGIIHDSVNRWAPQGKAICFVERKVEADDIEQSLGSSLKVAALHGDVSQQRRDQIISTFKAGKLDLLIATDVASRGIDIPAVPLVLHNEPTRESESFIHRSGRTGRAGSKGTNIVLFTPQEEGRMRFLAQRTGVSFQRQMVHPHETLQFAAQHYLKQLQNVSAEGRQPFAHFVDEIGNGGASAADYKALLCGSLALLCNKMGTAQNFRYRSHITGAPELRTHVLKCPTGERLPQSSTHGVAMIRRQLSLSDAITPQNLRTLADGSGLVFDLPSAVSDNLAAGDSTICPVVDVLPALLERTYIQHDRGSGRDYNGPSAGRFGAARPSSWNKTVGGYRAAGRSSSFARDRRPVATRDEPYGYGAQHHMSQVNSGSDRRRRY